MEDPEASSGKGRGPSPLLELRKESGLGSFQEQEGKYGLGSLLERETRRCVGPLLERGSRRGHGDLLDQGGDVSLVPGRGGKTRQGLGFDRRCGLDSLIKREMMRGLSPLLELEQQTKRGLDASETRDKTLARP